MCSINQKQYKDLFETEEKKRNKKKLFFFFLVYLHIGRGFSLNYATLYYLLYTLYFQTKTIRKKKSYINSYISNIFIYTKRITG